MRNPNYYANAGMPSPADYARAAERDRRAAMFPELAAALEKIAAIKNERFGGDWDEIEAARLIAITVLAKAKAAP
jgi:hypothetical protein